MGTNFYWKDPARINGRPVEDEDEDSPLIHIGKRSEAGLYCFDCGVTLVYNDVVAGFDRSAGNSRNKLVHTSQAYQSNTCPQCGESETQETLETSAAGLELGFRDGSPTAEERRGVRSCSLFGWAQDPGWVIAKLLELQDESGGIAVDECGEEYNAYAFLRVVLVACPLWFTDSVGTSFS